MADARPRLLDLFCCQGGAGEGYRRAGFEVHGVDNEAQPRNPHSFEQADAIEYLESRDLGEWDRIHASPPCQAYSRAFKHLAAPKPMLLDCTIELLKRWGGVWVVENVVGAPLATASDLFGRHGTEVCGSGLGLRVHRHRLFESSVPLVGPACNHAELAMNPHNQAGRDRIYAEFGRSDPEVIWRQEMGVGWMDKHGGRQAIPPAYTEYIGAQLMNALSSG